jgi:hypothetical protein
MPRQGHLEHLKAQEQAAREALAAQRQVLKTAAAKRKAAERRVTVERWRAIGRIAEATGLGHLDLPVLRVAFAHLASLAQDPDILAHWQGKIPGQNPSPSQHPEARH